MDALPERQPSRQWVFAGSHWLAADPLRPQSPCRKTYGRQGAPVLPEEVRQGGGSEMRILRLD
jgi:hypothetical protein